MSGLVAELQEDALNPKTKSSDLLRKAKVVSVKLSLNSITEWIDRELNGYPIGVGVPDYRQVRGRLVFLNLYHGWLPVHIGNAEVEKKMRDVEVREGLGTLESVQE